MKFLEILDFTIAAVSKDENVNKAENVNKYLAVLISIPIGSMVF